MAERPDLPDPAKVPLGTRKVPLPFTVPSPVRVVSGEREKKVLLVALHVAFPVHTANRTQYAYATGHTHSALSETGAEGSSVSAHGQGCNTCRCHDAPQSSRRIPEKVPSVILIFP